MKFLRLFRKGTTEILAIILAYLSLFCFAQLSYASGGYAQIESLNDIVDLKIPRHLLLDSQGTPISLYATANANKLVVYNWKNGKKVIANENAKGHSSGFVGDIAAGFLHLLWREKTDVKKLFYRRMDLRKWVLDSPLLIDESSAPLTRIKVGASQSGRVETLWYGERAESKVKKQYAIYAASSYDNGLSFTKALKLTPEYRWAIYPTLLINGEDTYMFTEAVTAKGVHHLICRRKVGKSWLDKVVVSKVGTVSLFLRTAKVSNRILVAWFNSYDGVPVTELAYSDDNGKTWVHHTFEVTRNLDLTSLQLVTNGKDKVYIALSGVKLNPDKDFDFRKDKDFVYVLYSHDKGTTWSELTPVRHYPFKTTRAHLPKIVAHDNTVVVVWNDYRNIRGNIYMNYSLDGGVTWRSKDIPLEEPGRFNSRLHWDANNLLYDGQGNYYVLGHRFKSDALEDAYLILMKFSLPN